MLLDIGGGTTSITTYVEDAITYSGSVPFGGTNITSDLAIGLRISLEDAEKIKINAQDLLIKLDNPDDDESEATKKRKELLGLNEPAQAKEQAGSKSDQKKISRDIIDVTDLHIEGVKTISKKMFTEIVEARLAEILDLVIAQVEQSRNQAKLPAGVVITGGSALVPGVTQIAKKVFAVPARIGYPKGLEGLVDEITGPAYSVAQGLVVYGLNDTSGGSRSRPGVGKVATSDKQGNVLQKIGGFFKNLLP